MQQNDSFSTRCLQLALDDPARALVVLWRHLRDHTKLQAGFDRWRCVNQRTRALKALQNSEVLKAVHPLAALGAVDELLATATDFGLDRRSRVIELSEPWGSGRYYLVPRREGWTSTLAQSQPRQREFWLRRHQIFPDQHRTISVDLCRLPERLYRYFGESSLSIQASAFEDGILVNWQETSPYRFPSLQDPPGRQASVEAILHEADEAGVRILVLPELTIDPAARQAIHRWLRRRRGRTSLALVVAGSFHENDLHRSDVQRNVAYVYDRFGDELTRHLKIQPMAITSEAGVDFDEGIEGGSRARLFQAPFGLVGLGICLDFCEMGDLPVTDLWKVVGPALMLVPSMGGRSTLHAHQAKSKQLALQHGTVAVVAQQEPKTGQGLGMVCYSNGSVTGSQEVGQGQTNAKLKPDEMPSAHRMLQESPTCRISIRWTLTER
ncbi:MAG: hypothetical protein SX243_23615 [Acidobacteriota bacterium]|nr:hypothetical protein [Acidobacteriota bacterium]